MADMGKHGHNHTRVLIDECMMFNGDSLNALSNLTQLIRKEMKDDSSRIEYNTEKIFSDSRESRTVTPGHRETGRNVDPAIDTVFSHTESD